MSNACIFTIWSSQEKVFFSGTVFLSVGNNFEIAGNKFVFLVDGFIKILLRSIALDFEC